MNVASKGTENEKGTAMMNWTTISSSNGISYAADTALAGQFRIAYVRHEGKNGTRVVYSLARDGVVIAHGTMKEIKATAAAVAQKVSVAQVKAMAAR
jgi:hypothetical protein